MFRAKILPHSLRMNWNKQKSWTLFLPLILFPDYNKDMAPDIQSQKDAMVLVHIISMQGGR